MLQLLPLTFLLWPFSFGFINSQIIGLIIFLIIVIPKFNFSEIKNIKISYISFFWYLIFFTILLISINFGHKNSEVLKFLIYSLTIPILFFMSFIYAKLYYLNIKNNGTSDIFYSAVPFLFFCAVQMVFPSFHEFITPYITSEGAEFVIENNLSGNEFRNLGWTGFLFAHYSVALAFTALGIILYKKDMTLISLFIELFCVLLAIISGRSGLPIIGVYIFISFTYRFNYVRVAALICISITLVIYMINKFGTYFFIWMLEPIYRFSEGGDFYSGSVNLTVVQFLDFFNSVDFFSLSNTIGEGVYFSDNYSYELLNFVPGDSGIIRLYYAVGIGGLISFLFIWISLYLKFIISSIKRNNIPSEDKIFILILFSYSLIFFFKSEWMYQKFFIFFVFYFYHKIFSIKRI